MEHLAVAMSSEGMYCNLQLETVDNGYVVRYQEKMPSKGNYDHVERKMKEFVFSAKEFKKAVAKYKEISDQIMSYKNS